MADYIIEEGMTSSGIVLNAADYMGIFEKGTADNTTVNSGGSIAIFESGIANDTTVNSGGNMNVYESGTANDTMVNSGGRMNVSVGGTATSIVENGGYVKVADGANVTFVPNVFSGLVISNASATVHSDTTADSPVIEGNGKLVVSSGGVASGAMVKSNAWIDVQSDGTISNTTIFSAGRVYVYTEGSAVSTTVRSFGALYLGLDNYGSGGSAVKTTIDTNGSMYISNGGVANSTTVSRGGNLIVSHNGIASDTVIESGGNVSITSGASANNVIVSKDGNLIVSYGGIATEIKENGGYVYIDRGTATFASNTFTGETVTYRATVHSGTTANSTTILSQGGLSVFNGGNANNTIVDSWGSLYISSGGSACDTTVNIGQMFISSGGYASKVLLLGQDDRAEGDIYISKGGVVDAVTVSDYGDYYVLSEGTAIKTVVNSTGNMEISSGGTATEIIENGGFVKVEDGAQVAFAANSFSGLVLSGWQSINKSERTQDSASIHSGTTAFNTDVQSDGIMLVFSGGSISNTSVCSNGVVAISSGGTADSTMLNRRGIMNVSYGGVANGITVNPGGTLSVESSGTATEIIENGGYVSFQKGANGTFISNTFSDIVLSHSASVHSGTVANNININAQGQLSVFSDGIANSTTVNSSGSMIVFDGGKGNSTTVYGSGECAVSSGGIADDVKVYAGGTLRITNGGSITGKMSFLAGAVVSVEKGAIINFDLSRTTEKDKSLLSDWSLIQGAPDYTITVKANQETRVYKLADSADEFDGTITVQNTSGESLGMLSVDGMLDAENRRYVLGLSEGSLFLTCSVVPITGKVISNEVVIVEQDEVYQDTTINSGGEFFVNSGGIADSNTINNCGSMWIRSGGITDATIVNASGFLYVSSGGEATEIVENGGYVKIADGANVTFVPNAINNIELSNTSATVHSNTTVNCAIVNENAKLYVYYGGTATDITENGGYVEIGNGASATFFSNSFTGVVLSNSQSATVHSGTTANDTTIDSRGMLKVYSGGTANSTIILQDGRMDVYSGGIANNTEAFRPSIFAINAGGIANSTVLSSTKSNYLDTLCGCIVYGKGTANDTKVGTWCSMFVSGGTANNTVVEIGQMFIYKGGYASNIKLYGREDRAEGDVYVSSGGTAEDVMVEDYGDFYICSGGTANGVIVNARGGLEVSSGGIANNTTLNDGTLYVSSGGMANSTTVNSSGSLIVSNGGSATIVFNPWQGNIVTYDGALITYLERDAKVYFGSNGRLVSKADVMDSITILQEEEAVIYSGCSANNTNVSSGGFLHASSGCITKDTIVFGHGNFTVFNGGSVYNTKVYAGGTLQLKNGAMMAGKMSFATGAIILVENGAILNFDLTQISVTDKAVLSDLSIVQGTPDYIITVKDNQETGIYRLADTANEFDETIVVKNTEGKALGEFKVGESFEVGEDTYTLRIDDESLVLSIAETHPADVVAPTVSNIQASTTTLTNLDVVLTADYADDVELASSLYRIGENGEWTAYVDGVTMKENGTVYFKAVDASGNESEIASFTVSNIDKVAPTAPTGLDTIVSNQKVALLWNVSTDDFSGVKEYVVKYSFDNQEFTVRTSNSNFVLSNADSGTYNWSVQAVDFAGNESAVTAGEAFTVSGFKPYTVEYSADNFEHVITFTVTTPSLDAFRMPTGTYQMRVKQEGSSEWMTGDPIVAPEIDIEPQLVKSDADGNADVFFVNSVGTWESGYVAQHVGSTEDTWAGTNEYATLFGKNKLADIIEGSTDANILFMTDDENGDALFVDDIYTALPGSVSEQQSRIAKIDEIRAGAGNDIVDMTSQNFEYIGDGLTIRGGEGNDTIWANKGDNWLFGDAGNDRIVGASKNDVIIGGIGNDHMHGGGGEDIFTFCDNWGEDNVEQLAGGKVTLWFAEGSMDNWNPETLTYTDGDNSVTVKGVASVTLKFGNDGLEQYAALASAGAFAEFTSQKIFEESGKGLLA